MSKNTEISAAFDRIADLMEIQGESGFRVNSYRRVARFLKSFVEDIGVVAADGRLTKLPGVGKGAAEKITQYLDQGSIPLLSELERKLPAGLPDLLAVQGLGPKKLALMHEKLGVGGLDDLKRVVESGALAELPGFGAQSVARLAEGIAFLEKSSERTALGKAMPIAEAFADTVRKMEGVQRVEIAGSVRRGCETIGDVDILSVCDDGERIVQAFVTLPEVVRVLASGATKGSVTVSIGRNRELQIDLRVVPAESFGAALQYFTGSKEHNVRLREMAVRKKLRLNEYGLYSGEERVAGDTEESIYRHLGFAFVPPELREDRGEFDFEEPTSLVTVKDIRGDLHMHTVASDGRCTIMEMAKAAKARGYAYIAITDHSKSSTIANGLSEARLIEHLEAVREIDREIKGIKVFTGCECDILPDGSLDYPDDLLSMCDIVIASIHARAESTGMPPTERLIRAIENPFVTAIGHATGRLIGKRPPLEIEMNEVLAAAAAHDTAMEINASWQRLDLKDMHVRQAIDAGVMLIINTDAHHVDGLKSMGMGVTTARRGGASPGHVLNTRSLGSFEDWIAKKRLAR